MTVAFQRMFGILERWNNNQVTPSLRKPHELSYRFNTWRSSVRSIEILQIEETSHRPLFKWQCQSANSVRMKERDDGRFFLSLSTLTLTLARADRFQAGLFPLSVISLWSIVA